MEAKVFTLNLVLDKETKLCVVEGDNLPFEVRRVFWVVPSVDEQRGNHKHKKCHQMLVPISGTFMFYIGNVKYTLNGGGFCGLYVPPGNCIRYKAISEDSIMMVLCSKEYDKNDSEVC